MEIFIMFGCGLATGMYITTQIGKRIKSKTMNYESFVKKYYKKNENKKI